MSEGLPEANILGRIEPWLKRGATALGYLKPVTKAAWANKRGTGVLAAIFVAGILRRRIRSRREETLPAERIWGGAVTTWAGVYDRLAKSAPASSTEYAKAQAESLESWCGGDPDFGYLYWSGNHHVDIVVVNGDWFHALEVKEDSGDVWCTSALISRLSTIETTDARDDTLRLHIGYESQGWGWVAQDAEAREALLSFTSQLRRRSEEVR